MGDEDDSPMSPDGIYCAIESPESSMMWGSLPLVELLSKAGVTMNSLGYCYYGR